MDIKKFLDNVCKEIKYKPVREQISEELEAHIQEIKENYINNNELTESQAEEKAVEQMGIPEDIGKKLNRIHRPKLDWKLLILILMLVMYGVFITICKKGELLIGHNIFYITCGLIFGSIIYFFDYRKIKKYSNLIYIIAILTIILAFIPGFGVQINGSRNYFRISGIAATVNTCTVSVPLFIVAFVGFLMNYNSNNKNKINIKVINKSIIINKDLIQIILCSLLSVILIVQIPLLANAIILGIVYLIIASFYIIKISENKKRILSIMYGSIVTITVFLFIVLSISPGVRIPTKRLVSSFKPELDPQETGYTGMLQKEILENAKLIGEANTEIITTDDYIIQRESNYTFIYLVGKIGIIVASVLVILVILTSVKLILNVKQVKDMYGKNLIIGLSSLYILQSVTNILMNINLGVQMDVNLPFVCDGGVYFVINCACIALTLSVYRRKNINDYYESYDKNCKQIN